MASRSPSKKTSANLGFEAELFSAADKLRGNVEPSGYKHVVLGLVFLRHISDKFEARHAELLQEGTEAAEDRDEYIADNIFWVPKEARWSFLKDNARQSRIGQLIDEAMMAIERDNPSLKGVLPKDYSREELDKARLGELVDLITNVDTRDEDGEERDLLGRSYEYFLGKFASEEGKGGGEFYTPSSIVRTLVEMIEPFPDPSRGIEGRVYDPACGSGGMFVQSGRFVSTHGGKVGEIAIYGQERTLTTWRLCKMNLAMRGIDSGGIQWNNEGSFLKDEHRDLRADFILANPPFNISDWSGERLQEDARWIYGPPPAANANYAWLQHIVFHLAPSGVAGVVLANGSMSSTQNGEDALRKAMIEGGVVDCMVSLPGQLFYGTQIPACIWILARNKNPQGWRDRRDEILFIDARQIGQMADRTRKEFTREDIARIADTYHAWRGEPGNHGYEDIPGFAKAASLDEVRKHNHILTPGRYVGSQEIADDGISFSEKFSELQISLEQQFAASDLLTDNIRNHLSKVMP